MYLLIALGLSAILLFKLFEEKMLIKGYQREFDEDNRTRDEYTEKIKRLYCDKDIEHECGGDLPITIPVTSTTRAFLYDQFGIEEGISIYSFMINLLQRGKIPTWLVDMGLESPLKDRHWCPVGMEPQKIYRLKFEIRYLHCVDFMVWYQEMIHKYIDANINIRFVEFDKSVTRTTKNSVDVYSLKKAAHDNDYRTDGVFFVDGTRRCNAQSKAFIDINL